ncbi:transcriptional regulator-domain-containing protein [Podospora conica]|nr:transcriptional regulator-domain-containing protein [Schizothecium conicum]
MASLSLTMRQLARQAAQAPPAQALAAAPCRRAFSSTPPFQSGHNKWSKIKHDKAAADLKVSRQRSFFVRSLAHLSKQFGVDSPQLTEFIARAKKAHVPKAVIEAAVARGQGRSAEGLALESVFYEAVVPPDATALIVDCQTSNRLRALQDIAVPVKKAGGAPASSKFFFNRQGRVVLETGDSGLDPDSIMDEAIEAGAEDIYLDGDGNIVVATPATGTAQVAQALCEKYPVLKVLSSKIVWAANKDTEVKLDSSPKLREFTELLETLNDMPEVQAVYANVSRGNMSDEEWARIADNIEF